MPTALPSSLRNVSVAASVEPGRFGNQLRVQADVNRKDAEAQLGMPWKDDFQLLVTVPTTSEGNVSWGKGQVPLRFNPRDSDDSWADYQGQKPLVSQGTGETAPEQFGVKVAVDTGEGVVPLQGPGGADVFPVSSNTGE